jgi:hypothetical protein
LETGTFAISASLKTFPNPHHCCWWPGRLSSLQVLAAVLAQQFLTLRLWSVLPGSVLRCGHALPHLWAHRLRAGQHP